MLFIFDENFPPEFVKGFSILEKANLRTPIPVDVIFSVDFMGKYGADDEEIIEKSSQLNAVIVTHDSDFKRIKHYKPLLIEHKVGYIYFRVPKGKYQYWDIVKAFINKWEEIKIDISDSEHPFTFEISKTGQVSKLAF
jgi:PIN like domain